MANSINATSTGNGGIITTGDDSGVLNIQTNETTAISIDASQNATFTNGANLPNTFGFKNRIINGGMSINQRALGTVNATNAALTYTVDRWWAYNGNPTSRFSVQQSSDAPAGFSSSYLVTSLGAYSLSSGEEFDIGHFIEGYNFADMAWGTASAKTVTVSFWVKSSLTGTFGGSLMNTAYNRSYPFTYTISAANTWEQKSVTIAGDTSGTWVGATNGIGLRVIFGLGVGSAKSGAAGAWASAEYESATGAVSVVGTSGATFYITGVQLEKGTQATSFDFRSYGTELALCQRYYQIVGQGSGGAYGANNAEINLFFPVSMRTTPSFTLISGTNALIQSGTSTTNVSSIDTVGDAPATYQSCKITVTSSGLTSTRLALISKANFAGASAEL